jgi:hypothetical protein
MCGKIYSIPDVSPKNISDGSADKVSLACDGGLVSGSDLLPLLLALFLLFVRSLVLFGLGRGPIAGWGF